MIDLGISKLALIGVVALVVIGPEKLPRVARMAGSLLGRAQRYMNEVKSEVSREIELEELRKMQKAVHTAADDVVRSIAEVNQEAASAWRDDHPLANSLREAPTSEQQARKVKDFRRNKLSRTAGVPAWYARQNSHRTRVISAAARVARFRPASGKKSQFFS